MKSEEFLNAMHNAMEGFFGFKRWRILLPVNQFKAELRSMYIGHGQFIHDTTYGHTGVQISRLGDQPWKQLLVACRRVK